MINYEELGKEIQCRTKFSIDDIFGKRRIRNLIYECEVIRDRKNTKIAELDEIVTKQSIAIDRLTEEVLELKKKNVELEKDKEKYKRWMIEEAKMYANCQDTMDDMIMTVLKRRM